MNRGDRAIPLDRQVLDSIESARAARLRYVSDSVPGIRRLKSATAGPFRYVYPNGKTVRDALELARIRSLVIPPAWTDVWICPIANGHIQATGRDARGRKQYRYHARWREVRDETKYGKMVSFGEKLPLIRRHVERDLARRKLSREKVLATVVRLLEVTFIRVGNEEYARLNRSFGLTTLRDQHVEVSGARVEFRFRGKSGKEHVIALVDRGLAQIVKRCRDLPGYHLFQYIDEDGSRQTIDSADVNEYIRTISGEDFTAKDFRTWAGTVLAFNILRNCEAAGSHAQSRKRLVNAVKQVSEQLGNTPAVCRKCYIHPAVMDCHNEGSLTGTVEELRAAQAGVNGLEPDEALLLAFLRRSAEPRELKRTA